MKVLYVLNMKINDFIFYSRIYITDEKYFWHLYLYENDKISNFAQFEHCNMKPTTNYQ